MRSLINSVYIMTILRKAFSKSLFFSTIVTCLITFSHSAYSDPIEESAEKSLPLPSVLFAKHIEAIGGEKLLLKYTTRTITSTLLIKAYGIEGDLNIIAEAPNKMKTTVDLGPMGMSLSGFNGSIGWSIDAMTGTKILDGAALKTMTNKANFYADNLQLGKNTIRQRTVDVTTFNGGEQYRVFLLNDKGEESYLYFSKESGLLTGMDQMELGAMGMMPTQIRLSNYVELDGLKTVSRISSLQNNVETIIEINSVSYEKLSKNAFDLPLEIQALVKD
jgi:hypothetical protein